MNNALAHLTQRIADLESRLQNVLQLAKVTVVHADTNLLDLEIRGVILTNVPYLTARAGTTGKSYWVPEVEELGMLLSPGGDVGNAVFLPALNFMGAPAPGTDANIMIREFAETVKEDWNGNDDRHMLSVGGDATRQTDKDPAKIEDTAGASKLTLDSAGTARLEASTIAKLEIQQSGSAELAATMMAKLIINAVAGNLMGAHMYENGVTSLVCPVGPVMFPPASTPGSVPSPPSGSSPDSEGKVTQTPPSTISSITVQAGSSFSFTLPSVPVTTPLGPGNTLPTPVSVSITSGSLSLQFPSQSL